jgi:hypothetical protein
MPDLVPYPVNRVHRGFRKNPTRIHPMHTIGNAPTATGFVREFSQADAISLKTA